MSAKSVEHEISDASEDVPALDAFVGYNLKRAYVVIYDDYRKTLGLDGFAPRVFSALAIVVQFPNITQSAVARHLGVERYGLVAIVDELEKRKLVKRTAVPGDRRAHALVATKEGVTAFHEAHDAAQSHEDRILADFSDEEKQTLMKLLQKIRNSEQE